MKRWLPFVLALILLLAFALPGAAAGVSGPNTYIVRAGWEDPYNGIELNAFFPSTLQIHVGDTVNWSQQTFEIHTVTFLAGSQPPDFVVPSPAGSASPIMFNPAAAFPKAPADSRYDGSSYANSGIMGLEAGQVRDFKLTFTKEGTFEYMCVVHGMMMSGKIIVTNSETEVASPIQAIVEGQREVSRLLEDVPDVFAQAESQVPEPVHNSDGTTHHFVLLGYTQDQIDLVLFFPRHLNVNRGDTVTWQYPANSAAPHTVTFLNGAPEPELVTPVTQPSGPPLLLINPAVVLPSQPGQPLTRQGIFNSGLLQPPQPPEPMQPAQPGPPPTSTYTLRIGDITGSVPYVCLLHDEQGMIGTLQVASR